MINLANFLFRFVIDKKNTIDVVTQDRRFSKKVKLTKNFMSFEDDLITLYVIIKFLYESYFKYNF